MLSISGQKEEAMKAAWISSPGSFPKAAQHSVTFYLNTDVTSASRNRELIQKLEEF